MVDSLLIVGYHDLNLGAVNNFFAHLPREVCHSPSLNKKILVPCHLMNVQTNVTNKITIHFVSLSF